jgi:flagellar protein FliO/FliZ
MLVCTLLVSPVFAAQQEQTGSAAIGMQGGRESPATSTPAADATSSQNPGASVVPAVGAFSWSGYFYAIGALCLILGALWGALWLMRRSGRFRFMPAYNAFPRDALRIEAQIPLGPRRGLMVVRFLNKRLLLGLSDQQVNLLAEAEYNEHAGADFSRVLEKAERQETDE